MTTLFFDTEVDRRGRLRDIGAVLDDGMTFHSADKAAFARFAADCDFAVGHNIIHHDLKYVGDCFGGRRGLFRPTRRVFYIDTLYWSPLLFPKKPYHNLVKNDKLLDDAKNNPLDDWVKRRQKQMLAKLFFLNICSKLFLFC